MQPQQSLEFLAMIVQDYLNTLPRSAQIALSERAQHCVDTVAQALQAAATEQQVETPAP